MPENAEMLTLTTVDAVNVELPVAGIGSRAYAFVVDWHVRLVAALVWLAGVALAGRYLPFVKQGGGALLGGLPAAAIYFLYHPVLEVLMAGRTPGKRMAGIRVVTCEGYAPPAGTHLARNLFRMLDSLPVFYALGLVVMASSARQTRIGDLAAGTLVVLDQPESSRGLETLSTARVAPQLALLVEELLRRWPELEAAQRRQLAAQLLQRAGEPPPLPGATDASLRSALQALLDDAPGGGAAASASPSASQALLQGWLRARGVSWARIMRELSVTPRMLPVPAAQQRLRDYRELARDVSLARRNLAGSTAAARLEALFRGLHALLHRDYEPWQERLRRLYAEEVPRAFRSVRGAVLAVAALFVFTAASSAWLVTTYPELASLFASESMIQTVEKGGLWTDHVFNVVPAPVTSAGIITNNVTVSLFAFVLGTLYGLGTLYMVMLNGASLGALFAFTYQHGVAENLLRFVVGHGVVELSVIMLSAGAGLRLGEALVRPGLRSRGEALGAAVGEAGILLAVVVPGLFVAGLIEGFLSPDPDVGWPPRLLAAGCSGFLLWAALAGKLVRPRAARN